MAFDFGMYGSKQGETALVLALSYETFITVDSDYSG